MKKKHLFILFFLLCAGVIAQEVTTIAATILDEETKKPLAFVNIGFAEKGIGTVSNTEGNFSLTWLEGAIEDAAFLEISSIGYETKKIPISELKQLTSYKVEVLLAPTQYTLDEVLVINEKREYDKTGSGSYTKQKVGYWMNSQGLGGEIATKIDIGHNNTQLHDLTFNIEDNKADSLLVRIKVYDYHRGKPGKNLLGQNIYHTISKKKGIETIPLKKYNILVNEDIIVSLELVKIYGNTIYFEVSGSPYKGISFTREVSLGGWEVYRGVGIAFSLLTSYPSKDGIQTFVDRTKPKTIDVFWDTSYALHLRSTTEELQLLKKYLRSLGEVRVRAIKFSKSYQEAKMFEVTRSTVTNVIDFLKDSEYVGASDFSEILKNNTSNADIALVFTDGITLFEPLDPNVTIPIFCVNSKNEANNVALQTTSYYSGGHYLNLAKIDLKIALNYLQSQMEDEYVYEKVMEDKTGWLQGIVYNADNVPLQGATVTVKNSFVTANTDANGTYYINAARGDVLTVNAFGMYPKDTVVGPLKKLHIPLQTNNELLDEVYLETATSSEKISDEEVGTPFGKKNRGSVGYSLNQTITSDDITETHTSLTQVLNWGRGIEAVPQDATGSYYKYRFRKYRYASFLLDTYAAFVVDGIVYDQNTPNTRVPEINPQFIATITLLQPASASIRYGSAAAFGAVVIETKQYQELTRPFGNKEETKMHSALATHNDYIENLNTIEVITAQIKAPWYIEEIQSAASFESAKKIFNTLQQDEVAATVPFYFEMANYFERWSSVHAEKVRSNIATLASKNAKALRALAYQYEQMGKVEDAKHVYEHLVNIQPEAVQSYLDLAAIYRQSGEIETAFSLYVQLLYNGIPNVKADEVQDQVVDALKHIVASHKSKVDFTVLPEDFLTVGFKQKIRIEFDWNNAHTDFELQFVSPDNKFFTFYHTAFNNKVLLEKEINDGFSSTAFVLEEAEPGRWLVNINYLGEPNEKNPTYLKYTLYRNYGLPTETKEIKVMNLSKFTDKITLDSIVL